MSKHDKLLSQLKQHLDADEKVQNSILGTYETKIMGGDSIRKGIFAATNKRLVFFAKKLTGYDMEVYPYSNISSIEMGKNVMGHHITLFASGNKVHMKWIDKDGVADFVTYVKAQLGKQHGSPSPTAASDPTDQLKRLAELKDQGVITEEEFAAKKKQVLGL